MTESKHKHSCAFVRFEHPCDCGFTHPEAQGNKDLGEPQTSFAWQKIDTAPKDGTRILLGCPASRGFPGVVEKAYWWAPGKKWWDWVCPDKPTHWAPLPPPPSERSEAAPTSPQPIKGDEIPYELRAAVLESASRWDDLATITEEDGPYTNVGFMRASARRLREALPPERETDAKSELESASNGMGLR